MDALVKCSEGRGWEGVGEGVRKEVRRMWCLEKAFVRGRMRRRRNATGSGKTLLGKPLGPAERRSSGECN